MGRGILSVEETLKRAKGIFPGAFVETDRFQTIQALRQHLHRYIQTKLVSLGTKRSDLLKRKNAASLCIAIGMNESMVEKRFQAVAAMETELGLEGKMPVLESVYHLVNKIEVDNPSGAVLHDHIEESYKGKDWLMYLGVPMEVDSLDGTIDAIETSLGSYAMSFMHGTTASVLKQVYDANGHVKISGPYSGKHDFGPGLYCFRGQFRAALSFAVDRSWPLGDGEGDNAAVVVFPDGPTELDNFLDTSTHVVAAESWRPRVSERFYTELSTKMNDWANGDVNWKQFVKLARSGILPFPDHPVFYGLLHDCGLVEDTDNCNEPVPDSDRWIQYCFRYPDGTLGNRRLFVELFIDWDKWIEAGATSASVDSIIVSGGH